MIRTLQLLLASANVTTAVVYPLLDFNQGVLVRVVGISCGVLAISLHRGGLFQPINQLNEQRRVLRKDIKRLESELLLLRRKLEQTATEKEKEFRQREKEVTDKEQNLIKQLEELATTKQTELAEREEALTQSEKDLEEQINAANEELQIDKEKFLKEQETVIAEYKSTIDLLESEIDEMRSLLAQYEAPALPEGSSFEIILVRRCMELLLEKRVVCEFKGVSVDPDGYVVARLKPQDGGQKAIEKWANHLHIEMELAEPPTFDTLRGAVQIWMKPQEMVRLPRVPLGEPSAPSPNPPLNPSPNPPNLRVVRGEVSDNSAELTTEQQPRKQRKEFTEDLLTFVEPSAKLPPYGAIRQIERDWVGYLFCFREPRITSQKEIIFRIWGHKSGDSNGYRNARSRLHTILGDAGIEFKRRAANE